LIVELKEISLFWWLIISIGCVGTSTVVAAVLLLWTRNRGWPQWVQWLVLSIGVIPLWTWLVYNAEYFEWVDWHRIFAMAGRALLFVGGLLWVIWFVERKSRQFQLLRKTVTGGHLKKIGPLEAMNRSAGEPSELARFAWVPVVVVGFLGLLGLLFWLLHGFLPKLSKVYFLILGVLIGLVMLGYLWAVILSCASTCQGGIWNPVDQDAWYYGQRRQKLKQSFCAVTFYTGWFMAVWLLLSFSGCGEIYELPAGGGEEQLKQKVVKIKKVIRKKYVINPYSAILFNPPPIEQIKLELLELTKHVYQPGQGEGKGAGFAGGTRRGKVRFIRLRYAGGDWDQDLDLNSDLNMLVWYAANTGHEIAAKPEVRTLGQLAKFPIGKSPPMVYMTGQRNISFSRSEIEVLREYLTDKHGMLFADNGGSPGWHSQFLNTMRQVLPDVEPIKVPLDHPVHRGMPFLPIVAPHGGRTAYGWVVESRLVAYYHPGDIGDAWADGHAGVPSGVYEACYRLGGNVILYSHAEYSKWLQARKKKEDK
jgi:hypothetical protein